MADLSAALYAVRDAAVAVLAPTRPAPGRRLVSLAPVTIDCEQLAVSFSRSYRGAVGAEDGNPRTCPPGRVVEADVIVMRCWPVSDQTGPPAVAVIEAAAEGAMDDGMLLAAGLPAALQWKQGDGIVSTIIPIRPQGGLGGVSVRVAFRCP